MNKTWLVAVVVLVACSGNTVQPGGGAAGSGGSAEGGNSAGSGGSANQAGESAQAGGAGMSQSGASTGGSVTGGATTGGGGTSGSAGAVGLAGAAGAGGGSPMIPEDVGSGACHDYTPCGGDLVGDWSIETCADPPLMGLRALCPAATETFNMSGSAQFRADGSMTTTLRIDVATNLPASCVAQLGTCGEPGGLGVLEDCTPGPAGSCLCESVTETEPSDSTYTTTPTGLLTVVRDDGPNYSYYCRQGDEVWARGVDPDNGRITVLHLTKQ